MAARSAAKSFQSARELGRTLREKVACAHCGGEFKDLQRHIREKHGRGAAGDSASSEDVQLHESDSEAQDEATRAGAWEDGAEHGTQPRQPPVLLFPGGRSDTEVLEMAERARRLIDRDIELMSQWAILAREEAALSSELTALEQRLAATRAQRKAIEDDGGLANRVQLLDSLVGAVSQV